MEKDPRARSQAPIAQGAASSALSGKDAGVWLVDGETEDYVQVARLNPHIEVLRQDHIAHHKSVLLGIADLPADTLGEILARNEDNKAIVRQMVLGLPMEMPSYTGYATAPNGPQNIPVKREIHPTNMHTATTSGKFLMPVFRAQQTDIPPRAVDLLDKWMRQHPRDLLYHQVAIQKALQWIWVMSDPTMRLDAGQWEQHPVPFFSLSDWFKCA